MPPWPTDQTPVFQIQRMYLKDLSLEQPNSPQILLEQEQPQVDINLGIDAEPVADGIFEVTVTATVTTKVKDKVLFLVEAKQAGIFEIRNVPDEQMQGIISIVCPQMIYPYLRAIVSDVVHARRLPADHPDRSQLPGHVRSAAGSRPQAQQRQRQRQRRVAHHHRRQLTAVAGAGEAPGRA